MNKNIMMYIFLFKSMLLLSYFLYHSALARTVIRIDEFSCDILRVKCLTDHVVDEHLTVLLQENVVETLTIVRNFLDVLAHVCKVSRLDHLALV